MRTNTQTKRELDKIDRNILRILQADGRISFTELGEKVGLSTTPCTERVRRLERDGAITGYYARLDPQYVTAGLLVFVLSSLAAAQAPSLETLLAARFVQGLGSALTLVVIMSMVRDVAERVIRVD